MCFGEPSLGVKTVARGAQFGGLERSPPRDAFLIFHLKAAFLLNREEMSSQEFLEPLSDCLHCVLPLIWGRFNVCIID